MIDVQLTYNQYHKWKTQNNISVIGSAFLHNELLREESLISYFSDCKNEIKFFEKTKNIDGHFAICIELEDYILLTVDAVRTFPIFYQQKEKNIIITDNISQVIQKYNWNDKEIENFKKVYFSLDNNTLLKDWKQLQAGEFLVVHKNINTVEVKKYFNHFGDSCKENEIDLIKKLKLNEQQLINKIISYANNRTILIPLSGGYDSRYLLSLLIQNNYDKLECFTYGKKDSYEVLVAKNVTEKLNIKWHFIEYTDSLLDTFFTESWNNYSNTNHHFTSLPHEQDFFALLYLKQHHLLPKDAVVMNGFCQDIHAGSFIEPINNFDLQKFIYHKHQIKPTISAYQNNWNGYQEWLIKNRLSKFIINSVGVYEYFGLDFYLPFWSKDWIIFWYTLDIELRINQKFYNKYLFDGIFKNFKIDYKKPSHDTTNSFYSLKKVVKSLLPKKLTKLIQTKNNLNKQNDSNNTLYLYNCMYQKLKSKPTEKDFKINNIHALYFLEKLEKENIELK